MAKMQTVQKSGDLWLVFLSNLAKMKDFAPLGPPKLLSINVTHEVLVGEWAGSEGRTGIDKRSSSSRVKIANDAVAGDVIIDVASHGGYDKAVYAYAREDAIWWEKELGISIAPGRFGENLTTQGIDVTNAVIGERWVIGDVILEVSEPRIPCVVFAGFWERPHLIKEFTREGRPGSYLRILREGEIGAGDGIEIISRPSHGVTISDLFSAKRGDRSRMSEISKVPEISERIREWALRILESNKG
jgi:MOSC domain-containing protein YiiM